LTGGRSHYVPEADYASIRELVINASFEIMPEVGHWLHAEDPEGFINHCLHYFKS
jgi:esterase